MLASSGGMERLRAAERTAKEKRAYLYAGAAAPAAPKANGGASVSTASRSFEAVVTRIWSGDQLSVLEKDGGKDRRLQLSSTRGPRYRSLPHYRQFLAERLSGSQTPSRHSMHKMPESSCARSSSEKRSKSTSTSSGPRKENLTSENVPQFVLVAKMRKASSVPSLVHWKLTSPKQHSRATH